MSPLRDESLPELDAIYIGGGFPETHAPELAANTLFSRRLREMVDDGLPVYAECGGLMYLGEELVLEGQSYPMAGILPVSFGLFKRPQGHGYTVVRVEGENPYYPAGTEIRGHEFHYSRVLWWSGRERLPYQGDLDFPGGTMKRYAVGDNVLKLVTYDDARGARRARRRARPGRDPLHHPGGGGRPRRRRAGRRCRLRVAEEPAEFAAVPGMGWMFVADPDGNWVELVGPV